MCGDFGFDGDAYAPIVTRINAGQDGGQKNATKHWMLVALRVALRCKGHINAPVRRSPASYELKEETLLFEHTPSA